MTVYISPNPGKAMAYGISQRAAQILLTHGAQVLMQDGLQAVLHQHLCPMGQQNLRRPLGNAVGHSLAGVWGNVDCHRPRPP